MVLTTACCSFSSPPGFLAVGDAGDDILTVDYLAVIIGVLGDDLPLVEVQKLPADRGRADIKSQGIVSVPGIARLDIYHPGAVPCRTGRG